MTKAERAVPQAVRYRSRDASLHPLPFAPHYRSTALRSPRRALVLLESTLTETTGPAFGHNAVCKTDSDLLTNMAGPGQSAIGERIIVTSRILDGIGNPVMDALLEFWQADAQGLYPSAEEPRGAADPHFSGWARRACDRRTGQWRLDTIRPGALSDDQGIVQAPHIAVWIVGRGIGHGLYTRLYFDDDERNARDPLLRKRQPSRRKRTLRASCSDGAWHFNIHLQGEQETVFINA